MLEFISSYKWPSIGIPFVRLNVRMDDLASRLGVEIRDWYEDGLGPARGFGFRSTSGHVYLVEELELEILHQGTLGPAVYVDAFDLDAVGLEVLTDEVIYSLGLARGDVSPNVDESVLQSVSALVAHRRNHHLGY